MTEEFSKFVKALKKKKVPMYAAHCYVSFWFAQSHEDAGILDLFQESNEENYELAKNDQTKIASN